MLAMLYEGDRGGKWHLYYEKVYFGIFPSFHSASKVAVLVTTDTRTDTRFPNRKDEDHCSLCRHNNIPTSFFYNYFLRLEFNTDS